MAFWKNDDSFAPFNVPQVGPTIPAMPTPDAKDAEIAKLRADLDQARRDRNSAVECAEVLRGYVAEGKAEIAKLRAERDANDKDYGMIRDKYDATVVELVEAKAALAAKDAEIAKLSAERDEWRDKAHSLNEDRAAARDAVFNKGLARIEAEKQLAAARAALDGEREACDRWRRHWDRFGYSATLAPNACVMDSIIAHDQRRAAEAKASRGGEGKP